MDDTSEHLSPPSSVVSKVRLEGPLNCSFMELLPPTFSYFSRKSADQSKVRIVIVLERAPTGTISAHNAKDDR